MTEPIRIGIVGGGQLGKMLTFAAKKMGMYVTVIDPTPQSPAGQVADKQIIADYKDEKAIRELASMSDVITFEIELANDKVLYELIQQGNVIHPSPQTLSIIKDKFVQKKFLTQHHIPVADFREVENYEDILKVAKIFGYPLLLKARTDAYDGRGNALVRSQKDITKAMKKLDGRTLYAEKYVPFVKELAIMVAKNPKGEIKTYPVVQTIHVDNICDTVIAPASISKKTTRQAQLLAKKTMKYLQGAGVFGIEMFLQKDDTVLINEIAPRVHNSGHYTQEACVTSQFEQHIRAITGLPLGDTSLLVKSSVMKNILGTKNGDRFPNDLTKALSIPGISLHLYGKHESRIQRKMGHLTIVGDKEKRNLQKVNKARRALNI